MVWYFIVFYMLLQTLPVKGAEDVKLLSGFLVITDTKRIEVPVSGGERIIRISRDGKKVYRVSLSNVYEVDIETGEGRTVFEETNLQGASWIEDIQWDPSGKGWQILLGNIELNNHYGVYWVNDYFKDLTPQLKIVDVDRNGGVLKGTNRDELRLNLKILEENQETGITAVGYNSPDKNKLIFFVKRQGGVTPLVIRRDEFPSELKSFKFSSDGKMAVAISDRIAVFYVIDGKQVKIERLFRLPETTQTQVLYREDSKEFVFVSKGSVHKIKIVDGLAVHRSDRVLTPESDRAFWGPIAVADSAGVLAMAHVFGTGFYDLDRGEANTFVKGDEGYDYFYGNFSAHSVTVSPDGRTFVFNGYGEVGVVYVDFRPLN